MVLACAAVLVCKFQVGQIGNELSILSVTSCLAVGLSHAELVSRILKLNL